MRLEKTIELEGGGSVTVKEMTPAIWNKLCKSLGEDILQMDIGKFMAMEVGQITDITSDLVTLSEGVKFSDLGYVAILEIWSAFREVSASFLSLLLISKEKDLVQKKEPVVSPEG